MTITTSALTSSIDAGHGIAEIEAEPAPTAGYAGTPEYRPAPALAPAAPTEAEIDEAYRAKARRLNATTATQRKLAALNAPRIAAIAKQDAEDDAMFARLFSVPHDSAEWPAAYAELSKLVDAKLAIDRVQRLGSRAIDTLTMKASFAASDRGSALSTMEKEPPASIVMALRQLDTLREQFRKSPEATAAIDACRVKVDKLRQVEADYPAECAAYLAEAQKVAMQHASARDTKADWTLSHQTASPFPLEFVR